MDPKRAKQWLWPVNAFIFLCLTGGCVYGQPGSLTLSPGTTTQGGTVSLNLNFTPTGSQPAGLQWTFTYSASDIVSIAVTPGAAATAAAKGISCAGSGGSYICLATGINTNTIASGVIAVLTVTLSPTSTGTSIGLTGTLGATLQGSAYTTTGTGSTITVSSSTPAVISSLQCNPTTLGSNSSGSCSVTLSNAAGANGAVVGLNSTGLSGLTVPGSVTVAANATTGSFAISTGSLSADQSGSITASYGGASQSVNISLVTAAVITSLQCNPTTLGTNASGNCTVTLSKAAGANGAVVSLSSAGLSSLTIPVSVTVAANATGGSFAISTGTLSANQSGSVTASYGGASQSVNISLSAAVVISSVQCNPTVLLTNGTSTCTITLTAPAPAGGATIALSLNLPGAAVPRVATVPAGSTTGTFTVISLVSTALTSASTTTGSVTVSYNGSSQTATLTLGTPINISSLQCTPATLGANSSSNCTVTLSGPAQAGGAIAAIASSFPPTVLTVPASVTLAANATTGSFTISTGALSADQNGTITVAYGGIWQTANISLATAAVITSLQCNPTTLGSNASANCTVTLSKAAGSNGAVVNLSSTGLSGLTVPGSVTVAANATTGSFGISTGALSADQNGSITASYGGASQSVNISLVTAAVITSLQCNPTTLGSNATANCTVTLSKAAGASGAVVNLSSTGLSGLTVPGSVTVAANATTGSFGISTGSLSGSRNGSITASYGGASQSVNISLTGAIIITSLQCDPTTLGSNASSTCTVTLSSAAPSGGAFLALRSSLPGLGVPRSASVPAGSTTGTFTVVTFTVTSNVTGPLTASYNGSSMSVTLTLTTSITISSLQLSCDESSLSGGDSTDCTVQLPQSAPEGGSVVSLSAANKRLRVPATVVIAEGNVSANFQIRSGIADQDEEGTIQASFAEKMQATSIFLRGAKPASLTCSPRAIRTGQKAHCELQVRAIPATETIEIGLSSSSDGLKLPSTLTTRHGQSTLGFDVWSDVAAKQGTVRIEARYGVNVVEQSLQLSSAAGPVIRAPKEQLAKFGDALRFVVAAMDSSGPVSLAASGLPSGASWDASTGEFEWTPDKSQAGRHEVIFTATNSTGFSATERVRIEVGSGEPVVNAVVNGATGFADAACSPSSIASLRGKWLFSGTRAADPSGNSVDLAGTRVEVNGAQAPVLYADPTRVDFLCPQIAAGTPLEAVVETVAGRSGVVRTVMQQMSPGIFSLDGSGQGLVSLHGRPELAKARDFKNAGQPAQPGDYVFIRATGFGAADALVAAKPLVKIGALPVLADAVDPVTGFAGVFDVKVKLPAGVPTGNDVPLGLEIPGGDAGVSNTVTIAIEPVRP